MAPALATVAASVVLAAAIVAFTLLLVRRLVAAAVAREIASVGADGVVLRSGRTWVRSTLRNYRGGRRYARYKLSKNPGEVLLVRDMLVVVAGVITLRIARPDLPSAEVWIEGGRLRLKTDKLTDASGQAEIAVALADPETWQRELAAAGATIKAA